MKKAKQSPSFELEYDLKYLGTIGNVFHTKDIEKAIELGLQYAVEYDTAKDMRLKPIQAQPDVVYFHAI